MLDGHIDKSKAFDHGGFDFFLSNKFYIALYTKDNLPVLKFPELSVS